MSKKELETEYNQPYKIPVEGSLGILAYGDLGLRAWRKVKHENKLKNDSNEKE